jgi:hypothetical protein
VVQNGNVNDVRLFFEDSDISVDVSTRGKNGKTALHLAAAKADWETARYLLERGGAIDAYDDDGNTALHYAVSINDSTTVRMLLECGADFTIRNSNKVTASELAAEKGVTEIIHLLDKPPLGTKLPEVLLTGPQKGPKMPTGLEKLVCDQFNAHITYFSATSVQPTVPMKVTELLYGDKVKDLELDSKDSGDRFRREAYRWIHLPANNVSRRLR